MTEGTIIPDGPLMASEFALPEEGVDHFFGTRFAPTQWTTAQTIGKVTHGPLEWPVVASTNQVHGTEVLVLDRLVEVGEVLPGGWDAIITDQPQVLITIRTADCVPILVYDPRRRVVGAIHAGWRGAVNGIVPHTMKMLMKRFGSSSDDLKIAVGPSAGSCCYEVDEPVVDQLREKVEEWESTLVPTHPGKGRLDLKKLVRSQAMRIGIDPVKITCLDLCTICRAELFHSYRREGEQRGTMVSGIMLRRISPAA